MGRSHLLAGAFVAVTVFLYVGCASKPKAAKSRGGAAPTVADAGGNAKPQSADGEDAPRGKVETPTVTAAEAAPSTIAQHAEQYAQNLESLLSKRRTAAPPEKPVAVEEPAPEPAEPAPVKANAAIAVNLAEPVRAIQPQPEAQPQIEEPSPQEAPSAPEPRAAVHRVPAAVVPQPAVPNTLALPTSKTLATQPPRAPAPAVEALSQQLTTRAKDYPRDVAAQLDFQLLQFLRDDSVPDLGALSTLPAEDRELLTTLIDGLSNFRSALRTDANMLQSKKVSPLLEMGDRFRGQGELTLPTTALCTKVERFGVYEPMEPAQFKTNIINEAILYCEVANFSSQLGDTRQWETRLKHECVLYSEAGLAVWHDKPDAVTDLSRNRRHDFYVVKRLRLPALPVGRFLLKVSVTDLQMNRVAEATVPITIVGE